MEIQNCRPSLEKDEEATPLTVAQMMIKMVVTKTTVEGLAVVKRRRMAAASSVDLPELIAREKMIGIMRTPKTPLSRKMGVRFIKRSSLKKIALTGWRPDEILRSTVLLDFRVEGPLRSLKPTSPL